MDIPTLKEIEFFEEISLVFWSNRVERQILVQREKKLLQFPPLNQLISSLVSLLFTLDTTAQNPNSYSMKVNLSLKPS